MGKKKLARSTLDKALRQIGVKLEGHLSSKATLRKALDEAATGARELLNRYAEAHTELHRVEDENASYNIKVYHLEGEEQRLSAEINGLKNSLSGANRARDDYKHLLEKKQAECDRLAKVALSKIEFEGRYKAMAAALDIVSNSRRASDVTKGESENA